MPQSQLMSWEEAVRWLIAQPEKQDVVLECYYDSPALAAAERFYRSEEFQTVASYLPKQMGDVLEIGAGRGISSYALAKAGWTVTALEPDPSDLVGTGSINALAESAGLTIRVVQDFGERLPFADASFDAVYARQVLHHARDLRQLCSEIARVLKPGGVFVATRDHVLRYKSDLPAFLDAHPLHKLYGGENAYLFREYVEALEAAPLRAIRKLRSFATPIHYDTAAREVIRQKVRARLAALPLLGPLAASLASPAVFPFVLKIASRFDSRPGTAASFVCVKEDG